MPLEAGLERLEEDHSQVHSSAPSPSSPDLPSPSPSDSPLPPPPSPHPAPSSLPDSSQPHNATPSPSVPHVEQRQEPLQQLPTLGDPQHANSTISNKAAQGEQDSYLHHADKFWSLYLKEVDTEDDHLVESWKGDTDGILIFTGLFAATVATFVTQTYQLLIPSSDDTNAAASLQISQQLAGLSNGTSVPAYVLPPFEVPFYAVWVNTLWFLSLFLSLAGALLATLMQQWMRRYLRGIRYRSAPHIRGPMRAALRLGVKKYKMKQAVTIITSIIHASVFIFFAGLIGFAFNLNSTVAIVLTSFFSALVAVYTLLSVLPMISAVSPYDTVLTPALQAFHRLGRFLLVLAFANADDRLSSTLLFLFLFALPSILASPVYFFYLLARRRDPPDINTFLGGLYRIIVYKANDMAKNPRSLSREQTLISAVKGRNHRNIPHAVDRVLINADEHHEVENLLDSMVVLWSTEQSGDLRSTNDAQALVDVFKRNRLFSKICSLINSCHDSVSNRAPSSVRLKRLRTVVRFYGHTSIRKISWNISDDDDNNWPARISLSVVEVHRNQPKLFHSLSCDPDPSVPFFTRLMIIDGCQPEAFGWRRFLLGLTTGKDDYDYDYFRTHMQSAADVWYTTPRRTEKHEWAPQLTVELVCTIAEFVALDDDDINDPATVWRPAWEPIFDKVKSATLEGLRGDRFWRENPDDLITEPIPYDLLEVAGLDVYIPQKSNPLERPLTEVQEKAIRLFHARSGRHLVNGLREIAEAASLIPYPPSHQSNSGPSASTGQSSDSNRRKQALATFPMKDGFAYVLFGPLTWNGRGSNRVGAECLSLMCSWCFPRPTWDLRWDSISDLLGEIAKGPTVTISDIVDDACQLLESHWVGEGYAMICFKKKEKAQWFAEKWTEEPLPAYRAVTADFIDNDGGGTSGDGGQSGAVDDARLEVVEDSEGEMQAGGESGGTDHDRRHDDEEDGPSGEGRRSAADAELALAEEGRAQSRSWRIWLRQQLDRFMLGLGVH